MNIYQLEDFMVTLKNKNTESCVVDVIKRIPFPPVRGGGVAEVTYPFLFKPSNK